MRNKSNKNYIFFYPLITLLLISINSTHTHPVTCMEEELFRTSNYAISKSNAKTPVADQISVLGTYKQMDSNLCSFRTVLPRLR
ncbi:MAG: hypothetical protein V3U54_02530 [Thermodesulfobacteriota bacterium]